MTAGHAEETIAAAIESVLNQSFSDFEFIIVNDGSTNKTRSIICSYDDKRIRLIDHVQNQSQALRTGLKSSGGKYIARMSADDIMHIDGLKIQYTTMEAFPEITVCSCREVVFGEQIPQRIPEWQKNGLMEDVLLKLLLDVIIPGSAYMIRRSFVKKLNLGFENYPYVEDYHLWVETAKRNGIFYIESQPLVYKRINEATVARQDEQLQSRSKTKREILHSLCLKNNKYPALLSLCDSYFELSNQKLISETDMITHLCALFMKSKELLIHKQKSI